MRDKFCSSCSAEFTCGSVQEVCWCINYMPLVNVVEGKDCMCEACLKKTIETAGAASLQKQQVQEDYYIENGFCVFTAQYHLKRGSCCKNGCRHCPYGFKK